MSIAGFAWWQLALGALGATLAICVNSLALVMVGKINEKLSEQERISYLRWDSRILVKYRGLYPGGKLAYLYRACEVGMGLCFAAIAIGIVFGKQA